MKKVDAKSISKTTLNREWRLDSHTPAADSDIYVEDPRVAKLLLVLSDLDESFGGVEGIEQSQLRDLICNALPACGFVNSHDACYAIAAVLRIIEGADPPPESLRQSMTFPSDWHDIRWFSPC